MKGFFVYPIVNFTPVCSIVKEHICDESMFEHGWSTRENVWKQNNDYMNYVETKYYSALIND